MVCCRKIDALIIARDKTLKLAAQHTETIIPAYTHGVQAQPTTFAHYLTRARRSTGAANATPARSLSAHQPQPAGRRGARHIKLSH